MFSLRFALILAWAFLASLGAASASAAATKSRPSCAVYVENGTQGEQAEKDLLALTDLDFNRLKSDVARSEAITLRKELLSLNPSQRAARSHSYFETQIKFAVELIRDLKRRGFDPDRDFPSDTLLKAPGMRAELIEQFDSIEDRAREIIQVGEANMVTTAQFLFDTEVLRSVAFEVERVRNGTWIPGMYTGRGPFGHFQDLRGDSEQFEELVGSGHILFPTFANLEISFFSGTWPRITPIGFSRQPLVDFDAEKNRPSYELPIHDLNDHIRVQVRNEKEFDALESVEKKFYAKVLKFDKRLEDFGYARYFDGSHESEAWLERVRSYLERPSASAATVSSLGEHFDTSSEIFRSLQGGYKQNWLEERAEALRSLRSYLGREPNDADLNKVDAAFKTLIEESINEVKTQLVR
ncbi:MAG: hypothetical protein V4692_14785 [Bdellovibrionota bacterium]